MADEPDSTSAVTQPIPEPTAPEKLPIEVPQPTLPEKLPNPQDAHSVPETGKESDKMMAGLSYLPVSPLNLIFCVINLIGDKKYNKFHGGQAIGWFIALIVFWMFASSVLMFSVILGPAALFVLIPIGLIVFFAFVVYPMYVGFQAFKGKTILMPFIGKFVLGKLNLRIEDLKA